MLSNCSLHATLLLTLRCEVLCIAIKAAMTCASVLVTDLKWVSEDDF